MLPKKEYADQKHDYKIGTTDVLNAYAGHAYPTHGIHN